MSIGHEKLQELADNERMFAIVLGAVILLAILIYLYVSRKKSRPTVLLTGLCDSGKTALFCRLVFTRSKDTFTSMKENIGSFVDAESKTDLQIVDLPGYEKLRYTKLDEHKGIATGIIFLIDSSTFMKELKDVAEFLYFLLTDDVLQRRSSRLIVACNKQDTDLPKGASAISALLEKELNTLRFTKSATVGGDASAARTRYSLGVPDKDFRFSDLRSWSISFCECSVSNNELSPLTDWLKTFG